MSTAARAGVFDPAERYFWLLAHLERMNVVAIANATRREGRRRAASLRSETGDGRGDDVGAAQVADETGLHTVHHVADGELGVQVHDDDGAAVATPVTGAGAQGHVG